MADAGGGYIITSPSRECESLLSSLLASDGVVANVLESSPILVDETRLAAVVETLFPVSSLAGVAMLLEDEDLRAAVDLARIWRKK